MIPVEVTQTPRHYTTLWEWLDHWQTGLAGAGAVVAAIITIWETHRIANRQITAWGGDAERVIAAAPERTEMTIRLERMHDAARSLAAALELQSAIGRCKSAI
jgi:prolipoprotein diacylglyceryltransferase